MNKLIRTLISLAAFGAGSFALAAEPAVKLVVVDLAKVLNGYYKTEDANQKFDKEGQKAQEQLDALNKQMQGIADQAKELADQAQNTLLKPEVRTQADADYKKKVGEFQQLQQQAQNFRNETGRNIQQRMKNYRDLLLEEISKVSIDIAKARGATVVMDKSGVSLIGATFLIYTDPAYDISDDVLKEVNKDRPVAPPAAPATAPTATPAAPAANSAPFTVPNVTPAKPAEKKP
ncbi:MAG TPA: OmpH family outer membrane protein [Candidatus Didemnitutus sp.]|nr:OmpH family outer membrane protein [Candidatus Didemnitutus sp.]